MNYQYFYQTRENENRSGWIRARDRADAYTQLRKRGVKPYRVVGDDPVNWRPWAVGGLIVALTAALVAALLLGGGRREVKRHQLEGDQAAVSDGLANGWQGVFELALDEYLAAYAQPGWIAFPPEMPATECDALAADLDKPVGLLRRTPVTEELAAIVGTMRGEMRDYLKSGGTVREYFDFLEERQDEERDFRNRAIDALRRVPEAMRPRALINMNTRLRDRGLAEIGAL